MLQATHTSPLHRQRERLCVSGSIKGHSTVVHRLVSLRPTPSPAWCRLQDRSSIHTTIVVAAGAGDQPELDEDESYEDFGGAEEAYDEDEEADFAAAEFADAPLDGERTVADQETPGTPGGPLVAVGDIAAHHSILVSVHLLSQHCCEQVCRLGHSHNGSDQVTPCTSKDRLYQQG